MFPYETQTKTVKRSNGRGIKQRQLFLRTRGKSFHGQPLLQFFAEALAHLGRGRLGECHHQNPVEITIFIEDNPEGSRHKRARLARAGTGGHEHVATRLNGCVLAVGRHAHSAACCWPLCV